MPIPFTMRHQTAIVPAEGEGFVELARHQGGTLYRKQILPWGEFKHPKAKTRINVDQSFAQKLVKNFKDGQADIVQVPIVDGQNQHTEDPLRNIGEVVDLTIDQDKGVFAVIDARKKEYADELGKTLLGASAMMHLDYEDTKTGEKVGPTLLHVAVTNRPYLTNLADYEQVIAASADSDDEAVLLTQAGNPEESDMELDDMLAALKTVHGIDVMDLQSRVEQKDDDLVSALSNVLREAGAVSLSAPTEDDGDVTIKDVADAVIELAQEKVELSNVVEDLKSDRDQLRKAQASSEVDQHVKQGRILPAQRDAMLELRLSNQEMYERLLPKDSIVALTEIGVTTHDEPASEKLQAEVERLANMANDRMYGKK